MEEDRSRRRRVVGILGGIGAGKSTVTALFEELGARSIDADELAHAVLDSPPTHRALRARWGSEVFDEKGRVDRQAIAARVFPAPEERRWLEEQIHPEVRRQIEAEVAEFRKRRADGTDAAKARLLILDIPLLAASPTRELCDEIVYVDAPLDRRRERTAQRGWSSEEHDRREAAQTPLGEKQRLAHRVIDNGGDTETTRRQVQELWNEWCASPRARSLSENPVDVGPLPQSPLRGSQRGS